MKELVINGINCSEFCPEFGLEVKYIKIKGSAGGTMLDGSTVEDVLATKAVLVFLFLPLDEAAQSEFLRKLHAEKYAQVRYFDPEENGYREIECIYSEPKTRYIFRNIHGQEMWKMTAMTFTER